MAAERLAPVNVREVDLDERDPGGEKGVADRHAGMGVRAGVDDGAVDTVARGLVDAIDESVLGVALEACQPMPVARGERGEVRLDVGERGVAVYLRLARAEQIQVRSVQQEQLSHSVSLPGRVPGRTVDHRS